MIIESIDDILEILLSFISLTAYFQVSKILIDFFQVDPSSIIPVSVSSSVASSASGSETDPECLATDEEEEEDIINGKINGSWMIPERISSRTPSPNGETEFEMDEPEFILTETIPEGPPPKKR